MKLVQTRLVIYLKQFLSFCSTQIYTLWWQDIIRCTEEIVRTYNSVCTYSKVSLSYLIARVESGDKVGGWVPLPLSLKIFWNIVRTKSLDSISHYSDGLWKDIYWHPYKVNQVIMIIFQDQEIEDLPLFCFSIFSNSPFGFVHNKSEKRTSFLC